MPHWARVQTPAPGSGLGASLEADKITLAHATLDFMRELHDVHTDLAHMRTRYPAFAALLDAAASFPRWPTSTRSDALKAM